MSGRIPIEMVDIGQLQSERGITYNEISQIIGSLYLDSYRRVSLLEEQITNLKKDAEERIAEVVRENEELNKRNTILQQELSKIQK